MSITRRIALLAPLAVFAAPAIVRAASLMPVRAWKGIDPYARYVFAYDDWVTEFHRTLDEIWNFTRSRSGAPDWLIASADAPHWDMP